MEKFHPWIEGQRKHPSWSRKRGIKGIARYASEKNLKRVAAKCLGYQRNRFKKKEREKRKKKRKRERGEENKRSARKRTAVERSRKKETKIEEARARRKMEEVEKEREKERERRYVRLCVPTEEKEEEKGEKDENAIDRYANGRVCSHGAGHSAHRFVIPYSPPCTVFRYVRSDIRSCENSNDPPTERGR